MTRACVAGPRIAVSEAKALVDTGEAVVVDAVASHVWPAMTRSIAGAIRLPPEDLPQRYQELPQDKTLIVYCTWQDEFTSARVASFLEKRGYRAFALEGGYMAWSRAGYPVVRKQATGALPASALCPECGEPLATHASEADE